MWNSQNCKTRKYQFSDARCDFARIRFSRFGIYLREKQVLSRSALTELLKKTEKFVRVIVPRYLDCYVALSKSRGHRESCQTNYRNPWGWNNNLVRGKLSQTDDWRKVIAKIRFPSTDLSSQYFYKYKKFTGMTHTWDNSQKPIVALHNIMNTYNKVMEYKYDKTKCFLTPLCGTFFS